MIAVLSDADTDSVIGMPGWRSGRAFISLWGGRAAVARYRPHPAGPCWEYAENWEELEPAALRALEQCGGWAFAAGHYPCPQHLAARARWPSNRK
jgi:hypothetical protein